MHYYQDTLISESITWMMTSLMNYFGKDLKKRDMDSLAIYALNLCMGSCRCSLFLCRRFRVYHTAGRFHYRHGASYRIRLPVHRSEDRSTVEHRFPIPQALTLSCFESPHEMHQPQSSTESHHIKQSSAPQKAETRTLCRLKRPWVQYHHK